MTTRISISGAGLITALGDDPAVVFANLCAGSPGFSAERRLKNFRAADYLSDRLMQKALSPGDALGLSAIEKMRRDYSAALDAQDRYRFGAYVGAPATSSFSHQPYFPAILEAMKQDRRRGASRSGVTSMEARPTTQLSGLPNNVLCFGASVLQSKGPNSNYVSGEVSGHLAVINACRGILRGQIDLAVAGGFSPYADQVIAGYLNHRGLLAAGDTTVGTPSGLTPGEGAVFMLLETPSRTREQSRAALSEIVGFAHVNGRPGVDDPTGRQIPVQRALKSAMQFAGITVNQVSLAWLTRSGIDDLDAAENAAIREVLGRSGHRPAVASLNRPLGHLFEAGGLLEAVLTRPVLDAQEVPELMAVEGEPTAVSGKDRYAAILRSSIQGEGTCLIIKA